MQTASGVRWARHTASREWVAARAAAWAAALLYAAPIGAFVVLAYQRRWVAEDAFIDFRVVQQLLEGHGPVFNALERVEAYSNPLWVALLTVWAWAGLPLEAGSVVLGLTLSATGLVCGTLGALHLARRWTGRERSGVLLVPLGALVYAALPPAWDFATSGLETGLSLAWMGASFCAVLKADTSRPSRLYPVATLVGLGALVRPDLGIFSLGFAVMLGLSLLSHARGGSRLPRMLLLLAAGGALPVLYQVFRMGYFAALVPNTAIVKQAGGEYWAQGVLYLLDFVLVHDLLLPLIPLAGWMVGWLIPVVRARDWRTATLFVTLPVCGVLHATYVVRIGGDFMHARMLLPSLFGLLLPVLVLAVPRRPARRWLVRAGVLVPCVWALAIGPRSAPFYEGAIDLLMGIADERGVYVTLSGQANPITPSEHAANWMARDGRRLLETAEAQPGVVLILVDDAARLHPLVAYPLQPAVAAQVHLVAAAGSIGLTGYIAGTQVHLVDRLGLADPIASRLVVENRGRPGHEKRLPDAWTLGRFSEDESASSLAAADALRCGRLAELMAAVQEPMTVSRFLRNIQLAPRLTALQVPADPVAARAEFCGRG